MMMSASLSLSVREKAVLPRALVKTMFYSEIVTCSTFSQLGSGERTASIFSGKRSFGCPTNRS